MSFEDLRSRIQSVINDSQGTFVTPGNLDEWLAEALTDISSRLQVQSDSDTGTTTNEYIALPVNFSSLIWLKIGDDYTLPVSDAVFNSFRSADSVPDVPLTRFFNNQLEVYPTPDVGTSYEIRYWNQTNQDLDEFPEDLQTKLVHYGRAMACYKVREVLLGREYMAMYETGLPPASHAGKRIGAMQIAVAPSYFDVNDA